MSDVVGDHSLAEADARLNELAAGLLGGPVVALESIRRGRNSRVALVERNDGRRAVVKQYFCSAGDSRDRLGTEYRAFEWLRDSGVLQLPKPLAKNETAAIAAYEEVPGEPIGECRDADVDAALQFLEALCRVSQLTGAEQFEEASEAASEASAFEEIMARRWSRLLAVEGDALDAEMQGFVATELIPAVAAAVGRIPEAHRRAGETRLSPSDFGFHNALRCGDGELVWLDFEYFGWDDPVKTVADFLLHPAMSLTRRQQRHFLAGCSRIYPDLRPRLDYWYALWALKWCVIYLNEFVAEDRQRRSFSGAVADRRETQLEKARRQLREVKENDYAFPF